MSRLLLTALLALAPLAACQPLPAVPPVDAPAPADGTAEVRVRLPRRLLAVAADVARVEVTLTTTSNGPLVFQKVLDRVAIAAAQPAVFPNLTRAGHEVTARAFDDAGRMIGSAKRAFSTLQPGLSRVDLTLQLEPTYTGATSPGTGVEIQVPDLPEVATLVATYPSPFAEVNGLVVAPDGGVWMAGEDRIVKFAADGTKVVDTVTINDNQPSNLHVTPAGDLWLLHIYQLQRRGPDGALLATSSGHEGVNHFDTDADGNPWLPCDGGVQRLAPDGTPDRTYQIPAWGSDRPQAIAVDAAHGLIWLNMGDRLARLALADGALIGEAPFPPRSAIPGMVVAPDGRVWGLLNPDNWGDAFADFFLFEPDGTFFTRTPAGVLPGYPVFAPDGSAWSWRGSEGNNVYKVSADGVPLGVHSVPTTAWGVAIAPDGNTIWVQGDHELYKLLP